MADPAREQAIDRGRAALRSSDWHTARLAFERARDLEPGADATEGLGRARYWLGDHEQALALLARAHAGHCRASEWPAAAGVAVHLAQLHALIEGDATTMKEWVGHAHTALYEAPDCVERGWVEVFLACITSDPVRRARHAAAAEAVARTWDSPSLAFDALAYHGEAVVEQGDLTGGWELVDRAVEAVRSGVVSDHWARGEILCTAMRTCELAVDARRARALDALVDQYVDDTGEVPVLAICKAHWGGLLVTSGRWEDAEARLQSALSLYDATYRGSRFEPLVRLAELRARQGRHDEVQELLRGIEGRPGAAIPRARVALAAGQLDLAAQLVTAELARTGAGPLRSGDVLLLATIDVARGQLDDAQRHVRHLATASRMVELDSVRGHALLADARVRAALGREDATGAYDEAIDALERARLAWEVEQARAERTTGPPGTGLDAVAAGDVVPDHVADVLTPRQVDVLSLLARGCSNREIAATLHISLRTAEHHVSNILAALGVTSRARAIAVTLGRED